MTAEGSGRGRFWGCGRFRGGRGHFPGLEPAGRDDEQSLVWVAGCFLVLAFIRMHPQERDWRPAVEELLEKATSAGRLGFEWARELDAE